VSSLDLGLCDWEARPRTSPGAAASSGQNCSRFCRRAPGARGSVGVARSRWVTVRACATVRSAR
jgi:hypothetical protein